MQTTTQPDTEHDEMTSVSDKAREVLTQIIVEGWPPPPGGLGDQSTKFNDCASMMSENPRDGKLRELAVEAIQTLKLQIAAVEAHYKPAKEAGHEAHTNVMAAIKMWTQWSSDLIETFSDLVAAHDEQKGELGPHSKWEYVVTDIDLVEVMKAYIEKKLPPDAFVVNSRLLADCLKSQGEDFHWPGVTVKKVVRVSVPKPSTPRAKKGD